DPVADIETINLELALADLESVEKKYTRTAKIAKTKDKEVMRELAVLERIKPVLEEGQPVRMLEFDEEEKEVVRSLFLLTSKPVLYVANVGEEEITAEEENKYVKEVRQIADQEGSEVVVISAAIEEELAELDDEEKLMFLEDLGITEPGLNKLIRSA